MMSLSFLNYYAPIFLLVALVFIIYAAIKLTKIPGNDSMIVLASIVISLMLVSSEKITNYLVNLLPLLTLIAIVTFFSLVALIFIAKDLEFFKKPLAWMSFILAILFILCLAFSSFHSLNHILPNSSDSGLSEGMVELKDFIYSQDFKDSAVLVGSIIFVCFFILKKK